MKNLFLSIALLVATTMFTANAQTATVGVRGGANISNLSGNLQNESWYENKVGFHGGLTFNFGIVENFFSIQPEILYSVKGFQHSDEEVTLLGLGGTRRREGRVNYNYLDVPILARIKAGPLYFEGGPQAAYLISVNNQTKTYYNGQLQSTQTNERSKAGLSQFEVGYAAGVGLASRNGISFGVRYNGAFSDFVKEDVNFEGDIENAKHSVVMITLGFTFGS